MEIAAGIGVVGVGAYFVGKFVSSVWGVIVDIMSADWDEEEV